MPTTIQSVSLGGQSCLPSSIISDGTTISCMLLYAPSAGSFNVIVQGPSGVLALDEGVPQIQIDLTITSFTPSQDINVNGGDVFIVMGTGLGSNPLAVSLKMPDGSSLCNVMYVGFGSLYCMGLPFPEGTLQSDVAYTITIEVNGVQDTSQ